MVNKGSSPIVIILAVLGLIFIAQFVGVNLQLYWPVIVIAVVAVLILNKE